MARPNALGSHTELLVLGVLQKGPAHGYAIAQEINLRTDGVLRMKEGTLYPLLHRMEKERLLRAAWQDSDRGPPRRIYQLTTKGKRVLVRWVTEWRRTAGAVSAVLGEAGNA